MNTCSFLLVVLVTLQVVQPYRSTVYVTNLQLCLGCVYSILFTVGQFWAFASLFCMPESAPLCLFIYYAFQISEQLSLSVMAPLMVN